MGKLETANSFVGVNLSHQAARSSVLPSSLPPRGLCREVAAAYIGIGGTKFDQMVKEGTMPKPRIHGGRKLWDRSELDAAFSDLPHEGEASGNRNPWDDILD
jgi:predicted DNA-binding transcriptional regulator AlpA